MPLNGLLKRSVGVFLAPFRKSMRYKLMLLLVVITVMPLSFVTFYAIETNKQSVSSEIIRSNESRMNWAARYFDEKFEQLQAITYSLVLDNMLFPTANDSAIAANQNNLLVSDTYINEKLKSIYLANNNIISQITLYIKSKQRLYNMDKDAFTTTSQLGTLNVDWKSMDELHDSFNKIINSNSSGFTLLRSMNRFETREVLGGVALNVRWKMMNSVLDMIHSEGKSQVFILDEQAKILYNPYSDQQELTFDSAVLKSVIAHPTDSGYMKLKEGYLFFQPVVSSNLWIIKMIPMSYITEGAASTLNFSFITALIFIVLAIIASIMIAYFTTKPIIRLANSMKAVEYQNFDVGVSQIRSDEIGTLERRFNSMLQRIKELIQFEYKSKMEKRTAQLKVLQAQINPHFLYNALQAIGGVALSKKVPEVYEHVRAMSDLFRYTVKMKDDLVTISAEMEHINNYLHIQKLRFQGNLQIHVELDSECGDSLIPKFSLQPIVENCFVHGLEQKMGVWTIGVSVQKVLDEIEITIEDNGIGMDDKRLEEINQHLYHISDDQFGNNDSIGLKNVDSRIKLTFGEGYGIFVTGSIETGTTVRVIIPEVLQDNQEEGMV
ncbi:sensor histidine kinase [Paenibacillus psychroresistens]|uniref:Sensor histidine kinase n=1 Tax=Paenibacillus psychroresistens TaxID=1778678 RepID=A0A6B8RGP3_9BACL|nr:sensor histidine kinase [Paenibacillus psychroresistens]QGQ95631.1 sensor histidine kinase [Paenibacillus psychroresistens]